MKKPKFNFGQGGMKGFLTQHVEKIVLGVVMLLVGVFVYSGYKREGYEKGDPQDMKTKAASAKQYVNEDHSIQIIEEEKRDKIENFPALVAKSRRAIPSSDYAVAILNPAPFPPTLPRQDPTLLPPEKVEVEGMLVAVYEKPEDPADPYANDKAGSIIATGPAPKKAPPKKDKGGGDDMPGMMPGMPGMPGLDGGGKGKGSRGGGKGAGGGAPALLPGGQGGGEPDLLGGPGGGGDLAGGMGGMMPGLGGGGGVGGAASLSADYIEKYVSGFRPGGAGGMVGPSMPNMQGPTQNASPFRPVSRYVVAVKAVVPHKQLADEYTRVFAEAQGYNPARDTPTYVYYYVERAEVGADPNAPLDWKRLSTNGLKARMANWGGIMPEVADPRYLDPMLSSPAPPAMMVDPAKLTLHSEVPRSTAVPEAPSQPGNASGGPGQQGDSGSDVPGGDVPGGFPGAPGMPGMPGMPGAGGMAPGMPGMPGAGGMAPGMPGMPGAGGMAPGMPGLPGAGGGAPALLPGAGGGMAPGMMPGMGGDGGMTMPGMGGMTGGYVAEAVKYKMIRFYDFDVQPGKKYKYRVRVLVEDPNYPRMADYAPDPRTLSATVSQRVKAAEDADTKKKTRTFWRETDWSQPSAAVGVPESVRFVGGAVQPGRSFEIRDQKLTVQLEEPVGSLLPVVWDINRAVEVPGFSDASEDPKKPEDTKPTIYRGTVLNFAKDVNVLRPDTLEVKKIEKNAFKTGAIVLDMRPGEPVRDGDKKLGEKKEPPKSAGEMLIVDAQGRMVVRNELDDIEDFRRLMFVGENSSSGAGGAAGGLGGPGMPGGMPGLMPGAGGADGGAAMPGMMPGMPGGDGGGGRKGRK